MSKIHNSVYGLAIGDASGYRTEFINYREAMKLYADENLADVNERLLISDDTQMSLYLLKAFENIYDPKISVEEQQDDIIHETINQFILWLNDDENYRAPGYACMGALKRIEREKRAIPRGQTLWDVVLEGRKENGDSKGSGTVMRSPWIGLLHGMGVIKDEELESFTSYQSSITHHHPTALTGSYLVAMITSQLYQGKIQPSEVKDFAVNFCQQQEPNLGWHEIMETLKLIDTIPEDKEEYDFATYLGKQGTAECVLVTAIGIIDKFGDNPLEAIRRSTLSSGDSDTVGAVLGGMLGAYYDEPIWESVEHIIEKLYVPQLDHTVGYLESLDKEMR